MKKNKPKFIKSPIRKEKKPRFISKENIINILKFLENTEKINLILINSLFLEIIKQEEIYHTFNSIKADLSIREHRFPLQLLLKKDAVLLDTILYYYGLSNLPENMHHVKFVSTWINRNYLELPFYNEKLDSDIYIKTLQLTKLNLSDMSVLYIFLALKKNKNIINLDLSENNIDFEMIKDVIYSPEYDCQINFNNLEELNLSNNKIKKIEVVNQLIYRSKIQKLDLSGNLIDKSEDDRYFFVDSVAHLKSLNLTDNRYLEIDNFEYIMQCYPNLTELIFKKNYLRNKDIKIFNDVLTSKLKFPYLNSLNMSNNKLGSEGIQILSDFISKNSTLTSLYLNSNLMLNFGAFILFEALISNDHMKNNLKILHVADNFINTRVTESGQKLIANMISQLNLEELNVSQNGINFQAVFFIAEALKHNQTIKNFIIVRNNIGEQGARLLGDALRINKSIEYIDVSGNTKLNEYSVVDLDMDSQSSTKVMMNNSDHLTNSILPSILRWSSSIKHFNISNNYYKADDCYTLLEYLPYTQSNIEILNLRGNKICYAGVYNLEEYFFHKKFLLLVSLDLSGNHIGDEGAKIIVKHLIRNKSSLALTRLGLADNDLFKSGMKVFAEYFSLECKSNLVHFDFRYNGIETEGMNILLYSLYDDLNVESLDITENGIDDIEVLARFFHHNNSIMRIDIRKNKIDAENILGHIEDLSLDITLNRILLDFDV